MEYYNFDARISAWDPATHTGCAEVLRSPAGEAQPCRFYLALDPALYNERPLRSQLVAKQLGKRLYQCLFQGTNGTLWRESYQIARERDHVLRLRLHIDPVELVMLPWETLYDGNIDDFLVFDPHVSLVRYLQLHTEPPLLKANNVIRLLVITAMPSDHEQLDWQHEISALRRALQDMIASGHVDLVVSEKTTHGQLHLSLLENRPDVVHFMGHVAYDRAQDNHVLVLQNESGGPEPLAAANVALLLRRYGVTLVVLNARGRPKGAWAGLAQALIRAEVPAVVAMRWSVEDRAAIRFTRAFYTALALGQPIDQCVSEGRVGASASSHDPNDWAAPVLYLRSSSGRLWKSEPMSLPWRESAAPQAPAAVSRSEVTSAVRPPVAAEKAEVHFETREPLRVPKDSAIMIDRPELAVALRLAQQPSVSQYIALLSPRDTGKTTLLLRMLDHLKRQYPCIFVDLSILTSQDARACFRLLAFKLVNAMSTTDVDPYALPSVTAIESFVEFVSFLREVASMVSAPRIILILDEVGALAPQTSEAFFAALRAVFTQGRGFDDPLAKYLFVFSGSVDLYSLLTSGTTSPLNICEKIYLADLQISDVRRLLRLFTMWGVTVPADAVEFVHRWTSGHPYLTMRFCSLLQSSGTKIINREAIDLVAAQILINDDNIDHVVMALERRPAERRRLQSILEGRKIPFTRNDPVLASLEMIGVIRPTQPVQIRNLLYERALHALYAK